MAAASGQARLNPTLFDKLVAGNDMPGAGVLDEASRELRRDTLRSVSLVALERFNEEGLRGSVRRELAWLLNTTNFESGRDLAAYPQVRTSVLNYGVPDLAGKARDSRSVLQRARQIRAAIQAFEPRIDPATLDVEFSEIRERENALTYVIHADVRSAVRAIPIKLRTDVESDTSAVTVRD